MIPSGTLSNVGSLGLGGRGFTSVGATSALGFGRGGGVAISEGWFVSEVNDANGGLVISIVGIRGLGGRWLVSGKTTSALGLGRGGGWFKPGCVTAVGWTNRGGSPAMRCEFLGFGRGRGMVGVSTGARGLGSGRSLGLKETGLGSEKIELSSITMLNTVREPCTGCFLVPSFKYLLCNFFTCSI